jgi:hypothetical protein
MENLEYSGQKKLRKSILACIGICTAYVTKGGGGGEKKCG